jgi:hypothetical protein
MLMESGMHFTSCILRYCQVIKWSGDWRYPNKVSLENLVVVAHMSLARYNNLLLYYDPTPSFST